MAEQHVAIFKEIGFTPEQIAEIEGVKAEEVAAFKPDAYVTAIDTTFRNKLSNDVGFLEKLPVDKLPKTLTQTIESGVYGRFMNELKEVAKKDWGVDIDKVPADVQKSLKGSFKAYRDASITDKPEALLDLQTKLQAALQDKESTHTTLTRQLEEAVAAEKGNTSAVLNRVAALQVVSGIKGLTAPVKLLIQPVLEYACSKYLLVTDPNTFDVAVMQKDNPTLKAMDSKGKELTFDGIAREYLPKEGVIDPKKAEEEGKDPKKQTVEVDKGVVKLPAYIEQKLVK